MFYWALLNVDPTVRFKTECIQLLAVAPYAYLKELGADDLLRDFLDTIDTYRKNDLIVAKNSGQHTFRLSLAFTVGDTPAQHWLGGFKSHTAIKFCQICNVTISERDVIYDDTEVIYRDLNSHLQQINMLETGNNREELAKEYGITYRSPLLSLNF